MEKKDIKEKPYYNVTEFAKLVGLTRKTIHADINSGKSCIYRFQKNTCWRSV